MSAPSEYRYNRLTWQEMNQAIAGAATESFEKSVKG